MPATISPRPATEADDTLAVVLTGGGARAAYQVGLLCCLARHFPGIRFQIVTGVSAGAINATYLAAHRGPLADTVAGLVELWASLRPERVFRVGTGSLARSVVRWGMRLVSGGGRSAPEVRSLLDTSPLRSLLGAALGAIDGEVPGILQNIERGDLKAFALSTLNYSTGQTVIWVRGVPGVVTWERPHRVSIDSTITVDHVMASAALPVLFPAVRLRNGWYGDGSIRLSAPLSPAIHLGARRILAISTSHPRTRAEADQPTIRGYPPPAQVIGALLNAVFLDMLDQDAIRLRRINNLLALTADGSDDGLRPIELLVIHPSQDLGRLAAQFEPALPKTFRFLTRSLGTRETTSPDLLSLLMFQPDYLKRLIEIGEADAEENLPALARLIRDDGERKEARTS